MKLLFVCKYHERRSPIAERFFKDKYDTKSAGLEKDMVTEDQLSWADVVVVMEESQKEELVKRFPRQYLSRRTVCANIPDDVTDLYELLKLLKLNVEEAIKDFK